jgi:hypothetical protein
MHRNEKEGLFDKIQDLQELMQVKVDEIARIDTNNKYKVQECEALERKNR